MYFLFQRRRLRPCAHNNNIILYIYTRLIDASAARVTTGRGRAVWAHRRVCGGRARQKARKTRTTET